MSRGEFQLIERLTSRLKFPKQSVLVGPGDDCAVVRLGRARHALPLLLTADMLIEGVHFRTDWMTPEEIGFKAMRVNLSDIAAMGGTPRFALVSVGLPKTWRGRAAEKLFRGLQKAGDEAGAAIVGGDTNASGKLVINVAVVGEAERILTRKGARVGDRVYVTGSLGGAALGLAALRKKKRSGYEAFVRRHKTPPLRLAVGRVLSSLEGVHALMDLSDGLAGDLNHLLAASGVGAEIGVDSLPLPPGFAASAKRLREDPLSLALGGGEDYELLFTASSRVKMPSKISGIPVTNLGKITPKSRGIRWIHRDGTPLRGGVARFRGFRHF